MTTTTKRTEGKRTLGERAIWSLADATALRERGYTAVEVLEMWERDEAAKRERGVHAMKFPEVLTLAR